MRRLKGCERLEMGGRFGEKDIDREREKVFFY